MIELLKKYTIKKAGFEIKTRGDCELLSAIILEVTDIDISYNTLRRFFGLDNDVKPSKSTLDVLARFSGYESYVQFLTKNPLEAYWIKKEKLYSIINEDSETILNYLYQIDLNNKETLDIVISLCRELVYLERIDELDAVLKSDFFKQLKFNYSELLHFGNSVGILFQSIEATKKILSNNNFLKYVYSIFVDYTQLNGYYGEWSEFISQNNSDTQINSFALALQQLKNYLNQKPVVYSDFIAIDSAKFHPILRGRLYSIKILSKSPDFENISFDFDKILQLDQKDIFWDYFFELIFTAILSRNFLLMAAILSKLSKQKINTKYYQEQHQKIYQLMYEYYSYWVNYDDLKENSIKNQTLISFEYQYSYNEIIQLFITILNYHYEKDNKEQYLKRYLAISKKLNYPLFSKSYLIQYFEK
jgi:hypothetical protein